MFGIPPGQLGRSTFDAHSPGSSPLPIPACTPLSVFLLLPLPSRRGPLLALFVRSHLHHYLSGRLPRPGAPCWPDSPPPRAAHPPLARPSHHPLHFSEPSRGTAHRKGRLREPICRTCLPRGMPFCQHPSHHQLARGIPPRPLYRRRFLPQYSRFIPHRPFLEASDTVCMVSHRSSNCSGMLLHCMIRPSAWQRPEQMVEEPAIREQVAAFCYSAIAMGGRHSFPFPAAPRISARDPVRNSGGQATLGDGHGADEDVAKGRSCQA